MYSALVKQWSKWGFEMTHTHTHTHTLDLTAICTTLQFKHVLGYIKSAQ